MGTEVKRIYSGYVDFTPLSREGGIALNASDSLDLLDASLSFYTLPTMAPLIPSAGLIGGENYRFYLNQYDVTTSVIAALQALITPVPRAQISAQYLVGASDYLRLIRSLRIRDTETANDEARAQTISNTPDWRTLFAKMGDRQVGWSGNLHPISFIYRYIEIPPLSLKDVWARHRIANPALPETLSQLPLRTVSFGQGPSTRDGIFDASTSILGGRLVYQIEAQYENPLKKPLELILKRLKDLNQDVDNIRVQYLEPVFTKIEQVGQDVGKMETSVGNRLQQLTDTVNHIA